jgi:hypothetical protein
MMVRQQLRVKKSSHKHQIPPNKSLAITATISYGRHNGIDNVGTVVASFVPLIPEDTPVGGSGMVLGVYHIICNLELLRYVQELIMLLCKVV